MLVINCQTKDNMARKNKYSEEFIKTAVSRVNAGIAQVQVANELGIKPQTLSRWCIAAKNGMSLEEKNESDEIRRLKKELEKAKAENEFLKKAAAFFAKSL